MLGLIIKFDGERKGWEKVWKFCKLWCCTIILKACCNFELRGMLHNYSIGLHLNFKFKLGGYSMFFFQ